MYGVISHHARETPNAPAIGAPGRQFLTYRGLIEQIDETVAALNRCGIGRGDWVATALPNGPEAAVATVAIACGAVVVPLHPGSAPGEFAAALTQGEIKALVLPSGTISPGRDVATDLGISVVELEPAKSALAGTFRLSGTPRPFPARLGVNEPDDVSMILRSSGTTARPKLFPWRQKDIVGYAQINSRIVLQITASDRCICLTPFFHAHGVSTGIMVNLYAGASAVCSPGLSLPEFFDWIREFQVTWYTAMPIMHQAIVEHALRDPTRIANHSLRFARSAAAPLPWSVREAWESMFQIRMIDAIGSTETRPFAHTPFPPIPHRRGSVGIVAQSVAIIDETGTTVATGSVGEIGVPASEAIRPIGSTDEDFPVANGWYRTGDMAYVDGDGYLFVMGRIKELINRGGEKIAPREVEAELLRHPAVSEAVVFPIEDPKLGQDVAAAMVLREGATATVDDLRAFVATRVARFKVPRVVLLLDRIPLSAIGKVQRNRLAALLADQIERALRSEAAGVREHRLLVPPRDDLERKLTQVWEMLLDVRPIGVTDDFFNLGGDSMASLRLLAQLDRDFGIKLSEAVLSGVSTIEGLAKVMRDTRWVPDHATVVPLKPHGSRPPLFVCLHGDTNSVVSYRQVLHNLDDDQPVVGVRLPEGGLRTGTYRTIEDISAAYVGEIRSVQPSGPYHLLGHSLAGVVAFEVARQLSAGGQTVAFLGLIDTACPSAVESDGERWRRHLRSVTTLSPTELLPYLAERVGRTVTRMRRQVRTGSRASLSTVTMPKTDDSSEEESLTTYTLPTYVPRTYAGKITMFLAMDRPANLRVVSQLEWKHFADGGFDVREIPGDHVSLKRADDGIPLARAIADSLDEVRS
jgi:acyl-CoA synthetase (AMP-forming)/AMP-acid ligase II/thioesterase domain-containing protein/acyl carrier protein